MTRFDVAIVGAGVLGSCVAYWVASMCGGRVAVLEAESSGVAHASSRNTGVIHSPFYLEPRSRSEMASAMVSSRPMWERLARKAGVQWAEIGVLEVALDDAQRSTLETHARWGQENGMKESELEILDGRSVAAIEPNVKCAAALRCASEAATDYAGLTRAVTKEASGLGVEFFFGHNVVGVEAADQGRALVTGNGARIEAGLVINCAGGRALDVARMAGQAERHTALHFRGEYWKAAREHAGLVKTSVYSVPRYPEYPFLDPHWIVRADGRAEIGPNAVPVAGPAAYSGSGGARAVASKLAEVVSGSASRLLCDRSFMRMAASEWRSASSRSAMVSRIRAFVPSARAHMFESRGSAGVRTPIVTPEGKMATDTIEILDGGTCSVINYNSPGATGAPAYAARLVDRLCSEGHLREAGPKGGGVWSWDEARRQG